MAFVNIFSQTGGVALQSTGERKSLITIVQPATGNEKTTIYFAFAPVTGISIKQLTDHTVNKALSGDFMLAAFGDTPADIQLSGVCFFGLKCGALYTEASEDDVMEFYTKNKISENPGARLDITMATSNNAFRCALIGMRSQSTNESDLSGLLYTYNLSLIGVPIKVENPT